MSANFVLSKTKSSVLPTLLSKANHAYIFYYVLLTDLSVNTSKTPLIDANPAALTYPDQAYGFFQAAKNLGFPVACWRMPNTNVQHFTADCSGHLPLVKPELSEMPMGFVAAPFMQAEGKAYFLQAHLHYQWNEQRQQSRVEQVLDPQWQEQVRQFSDHWKKESQSFKQGDYYAYHNGEEIPTGQAHYEKLVGDGIRGIEEGLFQKVVLSRKKPVQLQNPTHPIELFRKLCHQYPTAFISLISSPETGTWLGASPETLVSINAEGLFRTISLAGTQARNNFETLADASWRQKEIEEQALVSRYIINCFKKIRLREFEEVGPRTVQAGNLVHLRTDFIVDTIETSFPELPTVMLELLHPTSAVCGMPKDAATAFIEAYENYDRSMYSGYLGPVGTDNGSHLFVNLRCMQLQDKQAWLYAGAGITQDSNPNKEWKETEMKMETIKQVLAGHI